MLLKTKIKYGKRVNVMKKLRCEKKKQNMFRTNIVFFSCRQLSDIDNDGQLTCEEFVLAMHLCDTAKAGKDVKTPLPPDLIPPTFRKKSRQNSLTSVGSNDGVAPTVTSPQGSSIDPSFARIYVQYLSILLGHIFAFQRRSKIKERKITRKVKLN
jgi:hypothetical protein